MNGSQMGFRDMQSFDSYSGEVAGFTIGQSPNSLTVWDVTDPTNVKAVSLTKTGNQTKFTRLLNEMPEFHAFDGELFLSPSLVGTVANQNLHALPQTDLVIVTHKNFVNEAEQIADIHRSFDDMRVTVATTEQIYNEFSSGAQDITAIKDFVRMFYTRAGSDLSELPKYLLLFGDASYKFKDLTNSNTNYVPTFQSNNSTSPISSYATDDYFRFA